MEIKSNDTVKIVSLDDSINNPDEQQLSSIGKFYRVNKVGRHVVTLHGFFLPIFPPSPYIVSKKDVEFVKRGE